jgi:3-dehydroquinate synthase
MRVQHRNGAYEIEFASRSEVPGFLPEDAAVITDENVAALYSDWIGKRRQLIIPAGEEQKNLARFTQILEWLAESGHHRRQPIVALGGGVIGDLVGYIAASYMRGVPLVQVPTTLLAQVDSSVGGKVGVDLPQGKNLAGAFYPPHLVVVCMDALATLDERQFRNGMAEVWKYGFIRDLELVQQLSERALDQQDPNLGPIVHQCIAHKRQVVQDDEFETTGLRATLNFGHTVGHALEQLTDYKEFLHGEAISIGMVAEARIGERLGVAEVGTVEAVAHCLEMQGLPVDHPILDDASRIIESMRRDKKAGPSLLAMSLLTRIGECKLIEGVDPAAVESGLKER